MAGPNPKERILVVDDEPHLLDLIVDLLTDDGYTVDGVASGTAAIHAARQQEYHAALLDYNLGDMTGLALAKELRRLQEDLNVILMTAHASLDMAVKAIQADVYDYLIKPIDSNHLKRSLANALEKNRLSVENKRLVQTLTKANDGLERASELKSKFLSIVTHDLRTPLASIRGYAQLLQFQRGLSPEQATQFLNIIIAESDHMGDLVSDLMDVVSIEAGKLRIEKTPIVFNELLQQVASRMKPLAEQKKIVLATSLEAGDLPPLSLDRRRIDQVLTNLIGNAFKHTPAGGQVSVSGRRDGETLRLEVADTGEGIPKEALTRVFDQFFQVEAHASKKEGLGLGLTIAREIIHAHGGVIGAESEGTGRGAKFWFTLPLTAAPNPPAPAPPAPTPA